MNPGGWQWYSDLVETQGVREDGGSRKKTPEIEVQTRWYAGEFGTQWTTADGDSLRIVDFGEWNREPGPDFTGATLQTGDGTILRGDVEIDTDVRDWERHGHFENPDFDKTVLHVFLRQPAARFFTRTRDHRMVHQVLLNPPATIRSSGRTPSPVSLCANADAASALLHAAARHRLHKKALALAHSTTACGCDNAWFRAFAVALGYKRNKLPFLLLAERCSQSTAAAPYGEALLFGLSGFLDGVEPGGSDQETRDYLRSIWERWWSLRAANDRLIISNSLWTLGGIRPANHPHRRVAALAAAARNWQPIARALQKTDLPGFTDAIESLSHPFWTVHFNLNAASLRSPQALIGSQRLQDLIINIFYPASIAATPDVWDQFVREPGTTVERSLWALAERFFSGVELDRKFLKSAVHQQGLLQVDADFHTATEPQSFIDSVRKHLES